jgi:hypothetical protein
MKQPITTLIIKFEYLCPLITIDNPWFMNKVVAFYQDGHAEDNNKADDHDENYTGRSKQGL